MYISPKIFFGTLWNFLSIFSNVLRVIVSICGFNNCSFSQLHTANKTFYSVFIKFRLHRCTFLKTGVVALWIFSFMQKSFNQATNDNSHSQYIWKYWQKFSQWSKENFRRYVHLFQGGLTFVELFSHGYEIWEE